VGQEISQNCQALSELRIEALNCRLIAEGAKYTAVLCHDSGCQAHSGPDSVREFIPAGQTKHESRIESISCSDAVGSVYPIRLRVAVLLSIGPTGTVGSLLHNYRADT
jgi:hypothetical protein